MGEPVLRTRPIKPRKVIEERHSDDDLRVEVPKPVKETVEPYSFFKERKTIIIIIISVIVILILILIYVYFAPADTEPLAARPRRPKKATVEEDEIEETTDKKTEKETDDKDSKPEEETAETENAALSKGPVSRPKPEASTPDDDEMKKYVSLGEPAKTPAQ